MLVYTYHQIMPLSLPNSNNIVPNSVSLCSDNSVEHISGLFLNKTDAIQPIVEIPPKMLNTLQKLADNMNNNRTFYNTTIGMLNSLS